MLRLVLILLPGLVVFLGCSNPQPIVIPTSQPPVVESAPLPFVSSSPSATESCKGEKPTVCPESPSVIVSTIPDYRPEYFPGYWKNIRGSCDTREIVLEKAGDPPVDTDKDGCKDDGSFVDIYTGKRIANRQAQIDHVFSKEQAWFAGLYKVSYSERVRFFNDQENLLPVTGHENESKGGKGPSQWLPPTHDGQCELVRVYQATADRWHLTITPVDAAAIQRVRASCSR